MRRIITLLSLLAMLASLSVSLVLVPAGAEPDTWDGIRAGVGVADATWQVGAAAGQYSDIRDPADELQGGDMDPHLHATTKENSYGVQSRLTIRSIVVEGINGERVALVKSDNYLAQDYLLRRVGQLLEEAGSGVAYGNILHAASHNHSSPYYSTPSWGVWVFEDVVDLRMFEYQARAMRDSILDAEASLAPARMGATVVRHDLYKGNIMRPQTADDGSPAGYPNDYGDKDLTLLRFDRLTEGGFEPMGVWMNWGQHPESLDSYDLITADFLAPLERFVEQDTGATLVFSQGDVGSAEGPYDGWNRGRMDDGTLIAWAHIGHAQTERGARLLADSVVEGFEQIGAGGGTVPFATHFQVSAVNGWVPGPASHPYPGVSNCRTETTLDGEPGVPVTGLPDCGRYGGTDQFSPVHDNLKAHGIPVPEQYNASAFGAVEENLRLRLQVIKLGDVVLGSCACEAQVDIIKNFKSRANDVVGDLHVGFDWESDEHTTCTQAESGDWTCVYDDAVARGGRSWTFSDAAYRRWKAQVHNAANGWDDLTYLPWANAEPIDPAEIKGNFSTEELDEQTGYGLVVGVGHAGDYNGYTVSYREYMGYDHYRKALTSHGPHTADYMSTWLVRMARTLNDASYSWQDELLAGDPTTLARGEADEVRQLAASQALGRAAGAAYDAWQAALPDDVGPVELQVQPSDISRFDGTWVQWRGGSNAVDNPVAAVERLVDGEWTPFEGMAGEIQTMVDLPNGVQGLADTWSGSQEWIWTANFEAFTGGPNPALQSTPPGTYRFVVDGASRAGGATEAYRLEYEPFEVSLWDGVATPTVDVVDGVVTVAVEDRVVYPRTYESVFPFVADDGRGQLVDDTGAPVADDLRVCKTCSFRPWAFEGRVAAVDVTVVGKNGEPSTYPATPAGDGTWTVDRVKLKAGHQVQVTAGGVRDGSGNVNGSGSETVVVTRDMLGKGGPGGPGGPSGASASQTSTAGTSGAVDGVADGVPASAGMADRDVPAGAAVVGLALLGAAGLTVRVRRGRGASAGPDRLQVSPHRCPISR